MAYAAYLTARRNVVSKRKNRPVIFPWSSVLEPGRNPVNRRTGRRLRCFGCGSVDHLLPNCENRNTLDLTVMRETVLSAQRLQHVMSAASSQFKDVVILDTGATSSVVGIQRWRQHVEWTRVAGRPAPRAL